MTDSNEKRDSLSILWRERFEILDKIDGQLGSRSDELTTKERFKVGFRVFALLFGPFYYFFKGMWQKGFLILNGLAVLLVVASVFDAPDIIYTMLSIASGVVCSALATTDYYKKVERNEKVWPLFSSLPSLLISTPVLAVFWVMIITLYVTFLMRQLPGCADEYSTDLVKEIVRRESHLLTTAGMQLSLIRQVDLSDDARTCKAVLTYQGNEYDINYTITHDETNPFQYIVEAHF